MRIYINGESAPIEGAWTDLLKNPLRLRIFKADGSTRDVKLDEIKSIQYYVGKDLADGGGANPENNAPENTRNPAGNLAAVVTEKRPPNDKIICFHSVLKTDDFARVQFNPNILSDRNIYNVHTTPIRPFHPSSLDVPKFRRF